MADVVTDRLEGEIGIDESLNTGVTKGVRSEPWRNDARLAQVERGPAGYGGVRDRQRRRNRPEEEVSIGGLRSAVLEVVEESLTHDRRKRVRR